MEPRYKVGDIVRIRCFAKRHMIVSIKGTKDGEHVYTLENKMEMRERDLVQRPLPKGSYRPAKDKRRIRDV